MSQPSPFQIEQAMSVLLSVRQRLLADDPELASDERLYADMLEGEAGNAMDTIHAMLRAAVHARDMADAAQKRAEELTERYSRYNRRNEALRGACFAALDALGLRKIELPDLTASVREGRQSVTITDVSALSPEFVRVKTEPDKAAISAALKDGRSIAGAELSNAPPTLAIRTR